MWKIEPSADYKNRAKKYAKRHCAAFFAVHDNLDTYLAALQRGVLVADVQFGFVHHEPAGIKAIDQKGAAHAIELRLYVYPEPLEQVCYLLTLGDKNTQQQDIKHSKEAVKDIRSKRRSDG